MTKFPQEAKAPIAVGRALVCFLAAYSAVTVLATALTLTYGWINHSPQPQDLGVGLLQAPAFVATVPYHVVIMLVVWPGFAWLYFRRGGQFAGRKDVRETLWLSLTWLGGAVLVDYVCFVLIRHPWSLTPHEFYIDYEPWIGLIYVAILASPWIRLALVRLLSTDQPGDALRMQ